MLTTPHDNIKLSLEQMQQLEVVETRLSNLQNEIKIATKELNAAKNDAARITKEKDYQEALLAEVNRQLAEATDKITTLNTEHLTRSFDLSEINKEIASKASSITEKEMSLKDREDAVAKREQETAIQQTELAQKVESHENESLVFNGKVSKLQEVISTF